MAAISLRAKGDPRVGMNLVVGAGVVMVAIAFSAKEARAGEAVTVKVAEEVMADAVATAT